MHNTYSDSLSGGSGPVSTFFSKSGGIKGFERIPGDHPRSSTGVLPRPAPLCAAAPPGVWCHKWKSDPSRVGRESMEGFGGKVGLTAPDT